MSDRPAEIWCETGLYWDYKKDWSEGSWRDKDKYGGEKYVRADRIEELEAKLAKAVEALGRIKRGYFSIMTPPAYVTNPLPSAQEIARTTLAELKGQNDE